MLTHKHVTIPVYLLTAGLLCAFVLLGCGGGHSGGTIVNSLFGHSFTFKSGTQAVSLSVDSTGRYTVFAVDSNGTVTPSGGQGTVAGNTFVTQSADGSTTYSGTLSSSTQQATGTVQSGGRTLITFTAALVPTAAATAALSGTYVGANASGLASITVDPGGSGTLNATLAGFGPGGGLISLAANGSFTSADSAIAGTFTSSGGLVSLTFTRFAGTAVNVTVPVTKVSKAKWTVLVYLNAANNLEQFGPPNVNQMEQVGSTSDVNIVVQWKRAKCDTCGSPDWVGTRRYFITKDSDTNAVNSSVVQDMGTGVDMGSWHTLNNFIAWGQQQYPADHYALVIWNHGAGWRPTRAGDAMNRLAPPPPRAVSIDDSTNNEIETWEIPLALDVTPKMDIVAFDASLMQMAEVEYEMRNSTPLIVGSEESPPGAGYVYNTFLGDLVQNPAMPATQLGSLIVSRTLQSYGVNDNLTQSEIDTTKLQPLADAVSAFGVALTAHTSDSHAVEVSARQTAQSYAYPDNKDLWDYANIIKNGTSTPDLKAKAAAVQTAIQNAVLAEQHGTINGNSHGIAIYVPAAIDYLSSYSNLAWQRNTAWGSWLQAQPAN